MATRDDVKKLAALARLQVSDEELDSFTKEFDAILAYVGRLEELTLAHETSSAGLVRNVMREDGEPHETGMYTEKLAEQFPKRDGDRLSVGQIISYE